MSKRLKALKKISSENCISIIMNSHRTKPDYLKDSLQLKNLIKETEKRLLEETEKSKAEKLIKKLKELAAQIDHSQNIESLLLFVNEDVAEYVRLPIAVNERIIIDNNFATRDLVRAMHLETAYYLLVLSQEKVRLIEALNDKVVKEIADPFPFINEQFNTDEWVDLSFASRQSNLMAEFFNQADKEVTKVRNVHPLPVLICSTEGNYHDYLKVADRKENIFDTFLNTVKTDDSAQSLVNDAWPVVKKYTVEKNNNRKAELKKAVSDNKFLSDSNEIWRAIQNGRIQTLFIEQGLFQPAVIKDGEITYVNESNGPDVIDDIYDEMIERNMEFGGDVVFLPKGELKQFNGFGAIRRY